MILGYVITGFFVLSAVWAVFTGNAENISAAFMEGAEAGISFCLGIAGSLCLWSAVMELMEESGLSGRLAALLKPVLKRLFPKGTQDSAVLSALSENVSANLLGLGNAATPAGIRAARALAERRGCADELCLLVVLNTASIQLLPSTVAAVRASLGAASPFDILPAVLLCSLFSLLAGLSAAAVLRRLWR